MIWMLIFILSIASLLTIYSAISTLGKGSEGALTVLFRHATMLVIGWFALFVIHRMDFRYFSRFANLLFYITVVLLLLTLLYGANINNADRWLKIPGLGISFQTSDIAKLSLVLYISKLLTSRREELGDFKRGFLGLTIPIGIVVLLILPANFSTAALIGTVSFILLLLGGFPWKYILLLLGIVGIFLLGIIALGEYGPPNLLPRYQTWKNRFNNKMDSENEGNYQSDLAKYAIYSGGIIPKGPGTGSSRNFMPHPYSDMIFAFIIEEWGMIVGGFGLLFIYLTFYFRTIKIAVTSPFRYGQLVVSGLGLMIVLQALINMSVSVSLIPVTGQPLPLISLGGTSTIFTCISIAVILSVSRGKVAENAHADEAIEETTLSELQP
jgi:cell division protein FtsW